MKILIVPDKFKGSLSAYEVCEALSIGLKTANPALVLINKPMADGGDGSLAVLDHYFDLENITKTVQNPLGRPIEATYKSSGATAYIEMAAASGLVLLDEAERNCMLTTSYGTGELMADALKKGVKEIYLFIGGSATNDGGIGMASALGYRFYDKKGKILAPIGQNLVRINRIDDSQVWMDKSAVQIKVICDVNNPFYGLNGAAHVYAKQKGANPEQIIALDKGLKNLADSLFAQGFADIGQIAGAGAAGGLGGGAIAFLDAKLQSGIHTFSEITLLEEAIKECDLLITGEGKLDRQTIEGKVISGVCELAKKYNKKVIAVCGDADFPVPDSLGLQQLYTLRSRSLSLEEAIAEAARKLEAIGVEIGNSINKV